MESSTPFNVQEKNGVDVALALRGMHQQRGPPLDIFHRKKGRGSEVGNIPVEPDMKFVSGRGK